MNITFLSENNTLIDRYFLGEPGFSVLIEEDNMRVLFDLGYSDVFIRNAQKMGISLTHLDYVAISHGHSDHTWGFDALVRLFAEMEIEEVKHSRPVIIAHPETFTSVSAKGFKELGSLLSRSKLEKHFMLQLSKEPQWLSSKLVYIGQVPRIFEFEGKKTFGIKEGSTNDDLVIEDSALAYKNENGLVIITGCSHSGICNIIEYAKFVCGDTRIVDVIGGFHLQKPSCEQIEGTVNYFSKLGANAIHACHCTDLKSKIALSKVIEVEEVGVGTKLKY